MTTITMVTPDGEPQIWPVDAESELREKGYVTREEWESTRIPPAPEPEPPRPTVTDIKSEAARRIQSSGLRWMVEREISGGAPIPQSVKDYAQAVRAASNALESMDPLPMDYSNDRHWPENLPEGEALSQTG